MNINRFKLVVGAGLAACAFGAVPATASASETTASASASDPCILNICLIPIARQYINWALDTAEREYNEFQDFYRDIEDDLNAYLCRQTGSPTYCNH